MHPVWQVVVLLHLFQRLVIGAAQHRQLISCLVAPDSQRGVSQLVEQAAARPAEQVAVPLVTPRLNQEAERRRPVAAERHLIAVGCLRSG